MHRKNLIKVHPNVLNYAVSPQKFKNKNCKQYANVPHEPF